MSFTKIEIIENQNVYMILNNLNLYMTIGQYNGTDFKKASKILPLVPRDFEVFLSNYVGINVRYFKN